MNRSVKIILAISIAALFPIVVGLIAYLAYPNTDKPRLPYIEYPSRSACYVAPNSQSTNGQNTGARVANQACLNRIESQYQKDKANAQAEYQTALKSYDKVTENRIILVLIAALIGFILAFVSFKYTPIATGMSAASMVLVLVASGYYASIIKNSGFLIVLLYLACFIVLIAMFVFADKYFPAYPTENMVEKSVDTKETPESSNGQPTPQR